MARSKLLGKFVVALVVLTGLGFFFVRSVRESRSAPYTVKLVHLRNWTVAIEPASSPNAPMLTLRPPEDLSSDLFRQLFARAMESLAAPSPAAMPVVLQGEFNRVFAGHLTPDALVAAARDAGLESGPVEARCLAYRRVSEPGSTRQLYFVLFDMPAFARFREQVGGRLKREGGARADFDPAALSPVLFIAASGPASSAWLPLRVDPEADCVAPIVSR